MLVVPVFGGMCVKNKCSSPGSGGEKKNRNNKQGVIKSSMFNSMLRCFNLSTMTVLLVLFIFDPKSFKLPDERFSIE